MILQLDKTKLLSYNVGDMATAAMPASQRFLSQDRKQSSSICYE